MRNIRDRAVQSSIVSFASAALLCALTLNPACRTFAQGNEEVIKPSNWNASSRKLSVVHAVSTQPSSELMLSSESLPEHLLTLGVAEPIQIEPSIEINSGPMPAIGGRDIACRTAQNWLPAQVLRQRGRTLVQLYCEEDECERRAAAALARFLDYQARHQEDIGAASALKAYYSRIALSEQLDLLERSLAYVDNEAEKQEVAMEEGLPAGVDLSSFERRRLEIEDKRIQLLSQDRQLRCLLAQLSGYDYELGRVRHEDLVVVSVALDCVNLKAFALMQRQDLAGWKHLACNVNETSAPIFLKMIGTVVGSWGLPLPSVGGLETLLCPPDYSCLASNLRRELDMTVETHRRWICQAVDEKCAALELAYQRVEITSKMMASWRTRIEKLESLERSGEAAAAELAEARSALLMAEADDIERRLEAKTAEVDLAEAVGGLSRRCCAGRPWLVTGLE
ncbi:MAG: hypothetical protein AAGG44_02475 [Planctomycetota bacterium]